MKTTYKWLLDYIPDYRGGVEGMRRDFTATGTEVEGTEVLEGDTLLELAVTSNRVDCLGVIGLARELATAACVPLVLPKDELVTEGDAVAEITDVEVKDTAGCPRFTAHVIEGVKVGPSPAWLVQRLQAIGLRSVNNIVDATNYAMFVTNQPFHAFDFDKLEGRRIVVRSAVAGEKITAINGKIYDLTTDMTCICDARKPVAIAGVMGGIDSEVSSSTKNVLLETAAFDAPRIRATARRLGLNSDASYRFERGVDGAQTLVAARLCARLIREVAGGTWRNGAIDRDHREPNVRTIEFRHAAVARIAGIDVPLHACRAIFERLGITVSAERPDGLSVTIPSWRADLEREIDLVEEVIRVHGLDAIPVETSMRVRPVLESKSDQIRSRIKQHFLGAGYNETLTTSFTSEAEAAWCFFAATKPMTIRNAMRSDENALRQSLLPSLLRARANNQARGNEDIRLFEMTQVYLPIEANAIPFHLPIVGALLDGGYREARGMIEGLTASLGIGDVTFSAIDERGLEQLETSGSIRVAIGGETLGYIGRPLSKIVAVYDLRAVPTYLELRLDRLVAAAELVVKCRPLPTLPAVNRDLAVVVDEDVTWGSIEGAIRGLEIADLESLRFFDEYRGKQVGEGKKSLAFSLVYRHAERTLTGEEVDAHQRRVVEVLAAWFRALVRM